MRVLRGKHGNTPAGSIGPNALRKIRQDMLDGAPKADPPRKPWGRASANRGARLIVAFYKWAAAHELLPAAVYHALRTLEPLKARDVKATEPDPVRPAPQEHIDAALPFLLPQVRAMVELQLSTGMRPGEVVSMRTADLETTGKVWIYRPAKHKTQHHGHQRTIYIGKRGQDVLRPWLRPTLEEHLFRPDEAVTLQRKARRERRKTKPGHGNEPGTNRKDDPHPVLSLQESEVGP